MNENRFQDNFNFGTGAIKSGTKVVSSSEPTLNIKTTYNSLALSNKAMLMMGLKKGDIVRMFDMRTLGAIDQNSRFLICKAYEENGEVNGAKIGDNNAFSYSTVYSALLANDFEVESLTTRELVKRGLMEERISTKKDGGTYSMFIAHKKGSGTITPYNDGEPVEIIDGIEVVLYTISDIELYEHNPKGGNKTTEEEFKDELAE